MLTGSCHCGTVKWEYSLKLESVTACNCTLCSKYGALWAYGFLNQGIHVSGKTSIYSRDVSDYNFCLKCGGLAYYVVRKPDAENLQKIAVNMRLVTEPAKIEQAVIDHFDGLDSFEDLPHDGKTIKDLWF